MRNIFLFSLLSLLLLQACANESEQKVKKTATVSESTPIKTTKKDSVQTKLPSTATTKNNKIEIDANSFLKGGSTSIEVVDKTGKSVKIEMAQPKVIARNPNVKQNEIKTKVVKQTTKPAPSKNTLPEAIETPTNPSTPSSVTAVTPTKVEVTGIVPPVEIVKETVVEEVVLAFNHDTWDALLQKYVSNSGKVNYAGIQSDAKFAAYLKDLQNNPVQSDWSKAKTMAYWINAYNAFTIKLITNNYPVSKITDLDGGKPWDTKWIKLGEKTYSLNNIENDILRPTYKDARIHFAVNCAAKSCPTLLNRAWTADNLERNFEKQAKAFINNSNYNSISEKSVTISKIFEWYAVDFGDIISYLNKYTDTKINANATINYQEYDWTLNKQ